MYATKPPYPHHGPFPELLICTYCKVQGKKNERTRRNDGSVVVNKEKKKRCEQRPKGRKREKNNNTEPPSLPRPHLISESEYENERMVIHDMERGKTSEDRWATALHFYGASWREGRKEGMKGFYFNRVTLHPASLLKHIAQHRQQRVHTTLCVNNGAMVNVPRKECHSPTNIFIHTLLVILVVTDTPLPPTSFEGIRHKTAVCKDVHTFIHSYAVVSSCYCTPTLSNWFISNYILDISSAVWSCLHSRFVSL